MSEAKAHCCGSPTGDPQLVPAITTESSLKR